MTSIFGPGQVTWEGATGAIAAFAARALRGEPITIPGNPRRTRDFVYVDDLIDALENLLADHDAEWDRGPLLAASDSATPLEDAARMVLDALGSDVPIETPGGTLPPGEDESYAPDPRARRIVLTARPLSAGIAAYVDWLARHAAAQGRAQA
jgi:nucleoside-diphosphate-sugar epimerase